MANQTMICETQKEFEESISKEHEMQAAKTKKLLDRYEK